MPKLAFMRRSLELLTFSERPGEIIVDAPCARHERPGKGIALGGQE